MKNGFFLLLFSTWLAIPSETFGQSFTEVGRLPENINETSGIEMARPGYFWTFNDSGGEPVLFLIDSLGQQQGSVVIEGAWNRDWEDITKDDRGNLYIGNMGNNNNSNTDLTIFKIHLPDTLTSGKVTAEIIRFRYEDQTSFPPDKNGRYFDAEALMWSRDSLYIATKNRTDPFDGITRLYCLPDSPGDHVARLTGEYDTGGEEMFSYWITAGDISPDGQRLCLLSSDKLWIFSGFTGNSLFDASEIRLIQLPHNTQKEGVCFASDTVLYLTDEEWKGKTGRKLYRLDLEQVSETWQPGE